MQFKVQVEMISENSEFQSKLMPLIMSLVKSLNFIDNFENLLESKVYFAYLIDCGGRYRYLFLLASYLTDTFEMLLKYACFLDKS